MIKRYFGFYKYTKQLADKPRIFTKLIENDADFSYVKTACQSYAYSKQLDESNFYIAEYEDLDWKPNTNSIPVKLRELSLNDN